MLLNEKIFIHFQNEAKKAVVDQIYLGLGYTCVTLTNGNCGLCYTPKEPSGNCTVFKDPQDYEGNSAELLLDRIHSKKPLDRCLAIAAANALNQNYAITVPEDTADIDVTLHLHSGDQVAMVGYFAPIVEHLKKKGIFVQAFDIGKQVGEEEAFYTWAKANADALVLTATSLITNSTEAVFDKLGFKNIPSVLMGMSTIVAPDLYDHLGIHFCAGVAPVDVPATIKAIRNGRGTPYIHKHTKKILLQLS